MELLAAQLHNLTGGTKRTRELYKKGLDAALKVLNSEEFKQAVLDYSWTDTNGVVRKEFKLDQYSYVDKETRKKVTVDLDNQGVYDLIMSGWDKFSQEADKDLDVKATLYYKRWSNAIGYTYPSTFATWLNTKYMVGSETAIVALIAGNIVHEYMHNLGFDHAFNWNPTREHTVPYAIGYIVNRMVKGTYRPGPIKYKRVCRRSWRTLWITKKCRRVKIN